jgi:ParB-like chromosome segregation protein Spo0J
MTMTIEAAIRQRVAKADDPLAVIEGIRALLHELSPRRDQPIDLVRWIPLEQVEPNDYNPNSVARVEMGLLLVSITHDGYTQPCVTIYDAERDKYVIIDGFHRYFTMQSNKALYDACGGLLPCVVLDKDINERMAATVRHNRARGSHSVQGMSSMVFKMLENGMSDAAICNELGMEPEELLRLKHITGFSKLFSDREYNREWVTRAQIDVRHAYEQRVEAGKDEPRK